jgi:hypothetical protein
MEKEELRVFHATRLLDFDEVRREGLRPLVFEERIDKLRGLAAQGRLPDFTGNIDEALGRVDLRGISLGNRETWVWATPLRRFLHDGGCDVFFEHWGGEAVQRLAQMASPELEAAIRQIGDPAVVIAKIPAIGVCEGRPRVWLRRWSSWHWKRQVGLKWETVPGTCVQSGRSRPNGSRTLSRPIIPPPPLHDSGPVRERSSPNGGDALPSSFILKGGSVRVAMSFRQ